MTQAEIGEIVGVHANTVGKRLKLDSKQLRMKQRSRRSGEKRALSAAQERRIRQLITDKTPVQVKLPFALWTRKAVMALVNSKRV